MQEEKFRYDNEEVFFNNLTLTWLSTNNIQLETRKPKATCTPTKPINKPPTPKPREVATKIALTA